MIVDDDSIEEIAKDLKKFAEKVREQKMKIMQFDLDLNHNEIRKSKSKQKCIQCL